MSQKRRGECDKLITIWTGGDHQTGEVVRILAGSEFRRETKNGGGGHKRKVPGRRAEGAERKDVLQEGSLYHHKVPLRRKREEAR